MMVLIAYDISNSDYDGKRRLSRVAKKCSDWGHRVQNSVFECFVNAEQFEKLKMALYEIIDWEKDQIRFYLLGNNYQNRIIALGATNTTFHRESFVI